ncbi:hypothetical protein BDN72DRAFT_850792 [Pluteus cervinus]|uniref:Uncharacterized protein n=1 Tax=Pluteus cervinus TaxID=181527 RepID=A0ACD3A3F1_9AGAR|nr:hypothetical protein BDN72DRAFT_850792 [Pluteus cervinus]
MSANDISLMESMQVSFRSFRYEVIVCFTLVGWEWLLWSLKEWRLIRHRPWTPLRSAYFACRCYPLVPLGVTYYLWFFDHTAGYCHNLVKLQTALFLLSQIAPHVVLLYRCWVYAEKNGATAYTLFGCFLVTASAQMAAMIVSPVQLEGDGLLSDRSDCFRDIQSTWNVRLTGYAMLAGTFIEILGFCVVLFEYYKKDRRGRLGLLIYQHTIYSTAPILGLTILTTGFYSLSDLHLRGKGFLTILVVRNLVACRSFLELREGPAPVTWSRTEQAMSRMIQDAMVLDV